MAVRELGDGADTMFPDVEAVPPFVEAPALADLAERLIGQYSDLGAIRSEEQDELLSIAYWFETKPFKAEEEDLRPHTIAKCHKASPLWRSITGHTFVVTFREWFWDRLDERQREAVVFHELTHIDVTGPGRYALREHDVEEFTSVIRHFGVVLPGRRQLIEAYTAWEADEKVRRP